MSDAHRNEYLRRIHRAQDFIERNLTSELSLERIAREACFSPFHFHRVFSSVTGETLYQFILRLRLERIAGYLRQNDAAITELALTYGFSSSATFARAFQAHFGMSASEFRKNRKTLRKNRKDGVDEVGESGGVAISPTQPGKTMHPQSVTVPPQRIEVRQLPPLAVAYVRHVGPYVGDGQLFARLFGQVFQWAGPRGLASLPTTQRLTIAHDNPHITESDKLRLSVGITVPADTETSPPLASMTIPAGQYACATFEIASTEFPAAWNHVCGVWLPASGYQLAEAPCYEVYLNDATTHPERKFLVEIRIGVVPLS